MLINTDYKVDGLLDGRGIITGSMDNPQFNGYVLSDALSINGQLLTDLHGHDLMQINSVCKCTKTFSFC